MSYLSGLQQELFLIEEGLSGRTGDGMSIRELVVNELIQEELARIFVVQHLIEGGKFRFKNGVPTLTIGQVIHIWTLADGFGQKTWRQIELELHADWSHIRDSSRQAFVRMAEAIRVFRGLTPVEVKRMLEDIEGSL